MTDDDDTLNPPAPSAGDAGHAVVRAALGVVPYGGAALSEVLSQIISPPLQRRTHEWREEVMRRILALEERVEGFEIDALRDSEKFASTVMDAQITLTRSNAEEKRAALMNAVVNVALDRDPEEDRLQMFMSWIGELTPWHLRLLRLMDDPPTFASQRGVDMSSVGMGGISDLVERVFPEMDGQREFYEQLARDLNNRGLLSNVGFNVTMTGSGIMARRTTDAGRAFLRFISEPPELAE